MLSFLSNQWLTAQSERVCGGSWQINYISDLDLIDGI